MPENLPEVTTPTEVDIEHSRRARLAANVLSLSRLPLSIGAAVLTLAEAPASAQATANIMTEVTDFEGKLVRKHGQHYPTGTIKSAREATIAFKNNITDSPTDTILALNGPWLDERSDKFSQHVRRFALFLKGRIDKSDVASPLVRDYCVSNARTHYSELGVAGVESADTLGKAKTGVMASSLILHALFAHKPNSRLVKVITKTGTALSVASGFDYHAKFERAYQQKLDQSVPRLSYVQAAFKGMARTTRYIAKQQKVKATKWLSSRSTSH